MDILGYVLAAIAGFFAVKFFGKAEQSAVKLKDISDQKAQVAEIAKDVKVKKETYEDLKNRFISKHSDPK